MRHIALLLTAHETDVMKSALNNWRITISPTQGNNTGSATRACELVTRQIEALIVKIEEAEQEARNA